MKNMFKYQEGILSIIFSIDITSTICRNVVKKYDVIVKIINKCYIDESCPFLELKEKEGNIVRVT